MQRKKVCIFAWVTVRGKCCGLGSLATRSRLLATKFFFPLCLIPSVASSNGPAGCDRRAVSMGSEAACFRMLAGQSGLHSMRD